MQKIILNRINDIKKICKELKIKKFYVFGSATSDNFNNKSDIDILISFKDNLSVEQYTKNYFVLRNFQTLIRNDYVNLFSLSFLNFKSALPC